MTKRKSNSVKFGRLWMRGDGKHPSNLCPLCANPKKKYKKILERLQKKEIEE